MTGTRYPLLVMYRDILAGNGFVVGVGVHGRVLMVEEKDGFWFYGVNPGGISAGGASQKEAAAAFREMYQSVLFDVAEEARNFDAFKTEVERFFHETNDPNLADWWRAVELVRNNQVTIETLPKESADTEPWIMIHELAIGDAELAGWQQEPTPALNDLAHPALAA